MIPFGPRVTSFAMQLYLLHRCPFGHRASIALLEKQLPFEPIFFSRAQRPPELEAVGPYAKSPTLFDGDVQVWDSQIVLEYLEDRYPERPLMPRDGAGRAEARMLEARADKELGSKLDVLVAETLFKPKRDEAKIAEVISELLAALKDWDHHLEGRTFLVGDALSLADVTLYSIFPSLHGLTGTEIPSQRPHLRAWHERMTARPSSRLLAPQS